MLAIKEYHGINEEETRIEKKIRDCISNYLNESKTINSEVEDISYKILQYIRKKKYTDKDVIQKKINWNFNNKPISMKGIQFSFQEKMQDKNILCNIYIYQFPAEEDYDIFIEKGGTPSNGSAYSYKGKNNFLKIVVYRGPKYINYGELFDTIQHEMLHLSKVIFAGKEMENFNFVSYISSLMNNENISCYQKIIANICYIGREDEQDAFVNGAYAFLKEKMPLDGNDIMMFLKQTQLYSFLEFLQRTVEKWDEFSNDANFIQCINNIPKIYKLTKTKIKSWLFQSHRRLNRKTATMLKQYQVFLYSKGFRSTSLQTPLAEI